MTYAQALEYIHKTDWRKSKLGLDRMSLLLSLLGNPQEKLRFVHVGGTNGKGSVCSMLSSVLMAAGYRTGLYISPFIVRFNERIQVDGQEISDSDLAEFTAAVAATADAMGDHPTEFEMVCAIAFLYYVHMQCDVVVLEVGLGGRLDATNVIRDPLVSVITAIDLDHTEILGDTLESITGEKCGIIKPNCHTVSYEQPVVVADIIEQVCQKKENPLRICDFGAIVPIREAMDGQEFSYRDHGKYRIRLLGEHQLRNASLVLECIASLRECGLLIPMSSVTRGLAEAHWPARFEMIHRDPLFILDGAHNPHGAQAAADAVRRYLKTDVILLCGVLSDKDYQEMFSILNPIVKSYVVTQPVSNRSLSAENLAGMLADTQKPVTVRKDIKEAVCYALQLAKNTQDPVLACGSLYMAGEIIACFKGGISVEGAN